MATVVGHVERELTLNVCRAEESPWTWEGERVNLGRTGTRRLTYGDPCLLTQSWSAASLGHQEFFHTLQRGSSCMENVSDMREGLSASLARAGYTDKPFLGHEASYGARPGVSLECWWRGPPSCRCTVCCIPSPMLLQRGRSRWPWQCSLHGRLCWPEKWVIMETMEGLLWKPASLMFPPMSHIRQFPEFFHL